MYDKQTWILLRNRKRTQKKKKKKRVVLRCLEVIFPELLQDFFLVISFRFAPSKRLTLDFRVERRLHVIAIGTKKKKI